MTALKLDVGRYKSVLQGHQTALYEGNVDFLRFVMCVRVCVYGGPYTLNPNPSPPTQVGAAVHTVFADRVSGLQHLLPPRISQQGIYV